MIVFASSVLKSSNYQKLSNQTHYHYDLLFYLIAVIVLELQYIIIHELKLFLH